MIPTDVSYHRAVFDAAARVEAEAGPIDVWVNVAFTSVFAPFGQIEPGEYKRVTEVSYLGYVYGTMAALEYMRPRDHGTIVQVGSALAYRGILDDTSHRCTPQLWASRHHDVMGAAVGAASLAAALWARRAKA